MVSVGIGAVTLLLSGAVALVLAMTPPTGQDRAQDLAERLRCPVCTSVSVAESPSETAVAMRQVIENQVAAGRSDAEIMNYFRVRYGTWAVIDPPAAGSTLLLWLLPVAAAGAGVVIMLVRLARQSEKAEPELCDTDRARVTAALERRRQALAREGIEP